MKKNEQTSSSLYQRLSKYLKDLWEEIPILLFLIIFSILIFCVALLLGYLYMMQLERLGAKSDLAEGVGALLEGTLGVAIAFAGAWVAIQIASSGNKLADKANTIAEISRGIIREQKRREEFEECTSRVEEVIGLFNTVRASFEKLFLALLVLREFCISKSSYVEEYNQIVSQSNKFENNKESQAQLLENLNHLRNEILPKECEFELDEIKISLKDLEKSLRNFFSNVWATAVWNCLADTKKQQKILDLLNIRCPSGISYDRTSSLREIIPFLYLILMKV
jgi:hypothetical protein